MDARTGEPSVGELLSALVRETGSLVHQEMALARTEIAGKAKVAAAKGGYVLLGGALAHAGLLAFISALIIALGSVVPLWASALVIGVVLTAAGLLVVRAGISGLKRLDPVPSQAADVLKEVVSPAEALRSANELWTKEKAR